MIGSFGNLVFETSSKKLLTFDNFKRKGFAVFAEHAVLDKKPRLEHTGSGLDEISFTVRLDAALGLNPAEELNKIREVLAKGDEQKLIFNGKVLGDFALTDLDEDWTVVDNKGRLIVAVIALTIKEFVSGD